MTTKKLQKKPTEIYKKNSSSHGQQSIAVIKMSVDDYRIKMEFVNSSYCCDFLLRTIDMQNLISLFQDILGENEK
jgi:hypothetical protein